MGATFISPPNLAYFCIQSAHGKKFTTFSDNKKTTDNLTCGTKNVEYWNFFVLFLQGEFLAFCSGEAQTSLQAPPLILSPHLIQLWATLALTVLSNSEGMTQLRAKVESDQIADLHQVPGIIAKTGVASLFAQRTFHFLFKNTEWRNTPVCETLQKTTVHVKTSIFRWIL